MYDIYTEVQRLVGGASGAAAQSVGCGKMDGRVNVMNEKKF
jgi:hypothetical protein